MNPLKTLEVSTPSDREIVMKRVFNAPRNLVWDAMTKPELVKRWLHGPDGWILAVCDMDLRVGGKYRWVWKKEGGGEEMGMGGEYREVIAPEKLVATERFDESWYPGEAIDTSLLIEDGDKTNFSLTVLYESKEARDTALQSGMESGVEMSYDRLAKMLEEMV